LCSPSSIRALCVIQNCTVYHAQNTFENDFVRFPIRASRISMAREKNNTIYRTFVSNECELNPRRTFIFTTVITKYGLCAYCMSYCYVSLYLSNRRRRRVIVRNRFHDNRPILGTTICRRNATRGTMRFRENVTKNAVAFLRSERLRFLLGQHIVHSSRFLGRLCTNEYAFRNHHTEYVLCDSDCSRVIAFSWKIDLVPRCRRNRFESLENRRIYSMQRLNTYISVENNGSDLMLFLFDINWPHSFARYLS